MDSVKVSGNENSSLDTAAKGPISVSQNPTISVDSNRAYADNENRSLITAANDNANTVITKPVETKINLNPVPTSDKTAVKTSGSDDIKTKPLNSSVAGLEKNDLEINHSTNRGNISSGTNALFEDPASGNTESAKKTDEKTLTNLNLIKNNGKRKDIPSPSAETLEKKNKTIHCTTQIETQKNQSETVQPQPLEQTKKTDSVKPDTSSVPLQQNTTKTPNPNPNVNETPVKSSGTPAIPECVSKVGEPESKNSSNIALETKNSDSKNVTLDNVPTMKDIQNEPKETNKNIFEAPKETKTEEIENAKLKLDDSSKKILPAEPSKKTQQETGNKPDCAPSKTDATSINLDSSKNQASSQNSQEKSDNSSKAKDEEPHKIPEKSGKDAKSTATETTEDATRKVVVEEIVVKKEIPGTGKDDRLIEEWKKSEEKTKMPSDKVPGIDDQIVPNKESKDKVADRILTDIVPDTKDATATIQSKNDTKDSTKPSPTDKKQEIDLQKSKATKPDVSVDKKGVKEKHIEPKTNEKKQSSRDSKAHKQSDVKPSDSASKSKQELEKEKELKEHHRKTVKALKKLLPEEGHDSGVDESTQSKEGAAKLPPKDGRISPKKRQPRSVDPSPMKRTPQSTASTERPQRKVPMNKIEVGKSASPNIKNVRSKIGSLDNTTYKPGGGKVKIESKKLDFSNASSRIAAKNEAYAPKGGDKKIEVQKLKWSANSKIGSLDKKDHKPGGGDKKVESHKLNFKDKAQPKIGSKDNIKHKPGGGDVEIPTEKLEFKAKASSKVGSLDNVQHKAKGGDKKIFDDKDYLRQIQPSSNASPCKTPTSKTSSGRASGAISPTTTGTNSPGPQED